MQIEEYERQVSDAALPAFVAAHQLLSAIRPNPITDSTWLVFLRSVFAVVQAQSWLAAGIARAFYDAERERQIPGVPIHPVDLAPVTFERFVRDMEPARKLAAKPNFSADTVALRATRTVENAARRTVMSAVEVPDVDLDPIIASQVEPTPDPTPKPAKPQKVTALVRGWARVPTGKETCGFCWMLASRGAVYTSAGNAGAKISQKKVVAKTADGTFSSADMNQWHSGCDCKVVPVFRRDNWSGMDKQEAAWQLWKDEIQGRYSGNDALNAYRRLVEAGAIQKILAAKAA